MITRSQRKAIREAGPWIASYYSGVRHSAGAGYLVTEAAAVALNTIASEPESVAVAREKLLRVASLDSSTGALIWTAAHAYQTALRAAKKTRKR